MSEDITSGLNSLEREQELEQQIEYHNHLYWEESEPEISDEEYDLLVSELQILNPDSHIFTTLEEQKSIEPQNKYVHSDPMLSLEKFYSKQEVFTWMKKTGRTPHELFKMELKLDGISGRLENGNLATRGDGKVGENHTTKIPFIEFKVASDKTICETVDCTINGEIIITDKFFEDNLKDEFKNSRNAVAGLMGRKRPEEIEGKGVTFIDFDYDEIQHTGNVDAFEQGWDSLVKNLTNKGFPFDGIVIKLADTDYYKQLGNKTKSPKGAIAFKFANKAAITTIKDITWQVSRKGRLTPVAELEPIDLAGVTISRATCHNHDFVVEKFLGVGAEIKIERAGDVIPKVTDVIKCADELPIPLTCPCCDEITTLKGVDICCTNTACPDRVIENLVFMAKTLEIDELGRPTAEKMYRGMDIVDVFDFINVTHNDLLSLEGYGEKSATTLWNNIYGALNNINEIKFLASFGISGIGRTMTDKLLTVAGDLPSLFEMDKDALMDIEGVGEKLADNFIHAVIDQEIDKVYNAFCEDIKTPIKQHNNIADGQHENKVFILVNTPKGQYKFPARPVAEHRADYYAEKDGHGLGSNEWEDEVLNALERDTYELLDWLTGSTDWEDWKDSAERVNGDVKVSEEDFWCNTDDFEIIRDEVAENCKPKTICFTGKMPEGRKFYEGIASERGMKPTSSVNKDLDVLVISEAGWTSGKVKKAEKYGTENIALEDWL